MLDRMKSEKNYFMYLYTLIWSLSFAIPHGIKYIINKYIYIYMKERANEMGEYARKVVGYQFNEIVMAHNCINIFLINN